MWRACLCDPRKMTLHASSPRCPGRQWPRLTRITSVTALRPIIWDSTLLGLRWTINLGAHGENRLTPVAQVEKPIWTLDPGSGNEV